MSSPSDGARTLYPEAIRYLAKKYNISRRNGATPEKKQIKDIKESMFLVVQYAAGFFQKPLGTEGKILRFDLFQRARFQRRKLEKICLGLFPRFL